MPPLYCHVGRRTTVWGSESRRFVLHASTVQYCHVGRRVTVWRLKSGRFLWVPRLYSNTTSGDKLRRD
jgi:hypothetical protein